MSCADCCWGVCEPAPRLGVVAGVRSRWVRRYDLLLVDVGVLRRAECQAWLQTSWELLRTPQPIRGQLKGLEVSGPIRAGAS